MSDPGQAEQAGTLDAGDISSIFGGELIVSYDGLSQYRRHSPSAGHSACGLAALNCVRLAFEKYNDGVTGEDLIRWLSCRQGAEKIVSICELWNNPSHLDVEDLLKVPYFSNSVNLVETYYELCELGSFRTLLLAIQRISTLSAAIITKPPEIVACMKLPTSIGDVFLVFDSHTRPNHPNGAGFIFNSSIEATADYLSRLFWIDEPSPIAEDDSYGFQMDLIRQFCGYIIVPKPYLKEDALTQSLLDASMRILALTTELAESKATISSLRAELQMINHRSIEPPNVTTDWIQARNQRDRKYALSSLRQNHVPITCPMCAACNNSLSESGCELSVLELYNFDASSDIDIKILKQLSIAEEDYRVFQELQANVPFKMAPERQHNYPVSSETQRRRSMSFAQVASIELCQLCS
ncbi:hypothetical protein C0992_006868 [Termitomyces sp. T32_za158]|nr:hypothetical protein C0992_006868 [Termitomyces sp. T32_za158]